MTPELSGFLIGFAAAGVAVFVLYTISKPAIVNSIGNEFQAEAMRTQIPIIGTPPADVVATFRGIVERGVSRVLP